jgi:transposase
MENYKIGCDAHKHYSQLSILDHKGQLLNRERINHEPGALLSYLQRFPKDTPVALECVGNWYWIINEIEKAGCAPLLTDAAKAKLMMGQVNKTDKLDADGLARLLHNGTLPQVWIPPQALRDERELPRTRMAICKLRTAIKNRIHATLAKYAVSIEEESDIFSTRGMLKLKEIPTQLPQETGLCLSQEIKLLEQCSEHIHQLEQRIQDRVKVTENIQLLKTIPGVGNILSIVIDREIGDIHRFPTAEHFASYAGTTPTVKSSGGKTHYGHLSKAVNQYLKFAFIEAANVIVRCRFFPAWRTKHAVILYERIRHKKGHSIAVGALARHLAEAAFWILKKQEPYHEPVRKSELSLGR